MSQTNSSSNRPTPQDESNGLRERIKQLEADRERDREQILLLQIERDGILNLLQMLTKPPVSDADWDKVIRDNDCKTLAEFWPELEQAAR